MFSLRARASLLICLGCSSQRMKRPEAYLSKKGFYAEKFVRRRRKRCEQLLNLDDENQSFSRKIIETNTESFFSCAAASFETIVMASEKIIRDKSALFASPLL